MENEQGRFTSTDKVYAGGIMSKVIYRPVCVVQREILYFAEKLPDCPEKQAIIDRVHEALRMSKKMDRRLKNLQPGYSKKMWSKDHRGGKKFEPADPEELC
jgi:hypothetical protein